MPALLVRTCQDLGAHPQALDFNEYVLILINFSVTPLSLLGVRLLIRQRQSILDLNQRLQSQAQLTAEMIKLKERNELAEAMHDTLPAAFIPN